MIVLDTSVALALLAGNSGARDLLRERRPLAPHLIDAEVTHAVRGLSLGGKLDADAAAEMLTAWTSLAIERVPMAPLIPRVWELRSNLTSYDAMFVAAAEQWSVPLLTADRRLATAPGPTCTIELLPS